MAFVRLFLLYAILIFAKKAPDMIKDMLKIKGDNIGLKGLNIKNKMGEAALVGDKVKKGMTGIEGRAKGTVGGAVGGFLRGRGGLRNRRDAARAGASKGYAKGKHDALENKDTKGIFSGAYKEMGNIASGGRTSFFNRPKDWLQQADDRFIKGTAGHANRYANPITAENQIKLDGLKAELSKRYGAHTADRMLRHAIERTQRQFRGPLNLSNEEQWMFLTKGKTINPATGLYVDDPSDFKGLNDAIDYSGASSSYVFDGGPQTYRGNINANINDAYRYQNLATNIEKARSAFEQANQDLHMPGLSASEITVFTNARDAAWNKYLQQLQIANSQGAFVVNVNTTARTVNGQGLEAYISNTDNVKVDINKRFDAFKSNADSAVQKEEIKQKTEDSSK